MITLRLALCLLLVVGVASLRIGRATVRGIAPLRAVPHHELANLYPGFLLAREYGQATVQAYSREPLAAWTVPTILSLVAGTIALPLVARKRQVNKNTTKAEDETLPEEDGLSEYERYQKANE
mmetsp:Transcript_17062/g.37925  ORF Transcript_17062/g.37925 Transcript_17062/m.37925 type:complete len:123 (-) Transcript_17062:485-853(-)